MADYSTIAYILAAIIALYFSVKQIDNTINNRRLALEKSQEESISVLKNLNSDIVFKTVDTEISIGIDTKDNKLHVTSKSKLHYTLDLSLVIDVDLVEDQITVNSSRRSIGGAIVGAVVAGGAGAIIGGLGSKNTSEQGVSSIAIKVYLNDKETPYALMPIFHGASLHRNSVAYEFYRDQSENLFSILKSYSVKNTKPTDMVNNSSIADELNKLQTLLDNKTITAEEFLTIKRKLLS